MSNICGYGGLNQPQPPCGAGVSPEAVDHRVKKYKKLNHIAFQYLIIYQVKGSKSRKNQMMVF